MENLFKKLLISSILTAFIIGIAYGAENQLEKFSYYKSRLNPKSVRQVEKLVDKVKSISSTMSDEDQKIYIKKLDKNISGLKSVYSSRTNYLDLLNYLQVGVGNIKEKGTSAGEPYSCVEYSSSFPGCIGGRVIYKKDQHGCDIEPICISNPIINDIKSLCRGETMTCGKEMACEGKTIYLHGYTSPGNITADSFLFNSTLSFQGGELHVKSKEIFSSGLINNLQQREEEKLPIIVKGIIEGIDLPSNRSCNRWIIMNISPEDIYFP